MGKRGRPGKTKWVVSDWLEELDGAELWLTVIATAGWVLLLIWVLWVQ